MKVYLDLVFFMNFGFDFLLLLTVNLVLKRNRKLVSILVGSLIGALSIFFLFLPLNSVTLFLLKVLISLLMIWATFGFFSWKTFFTNTVYLYFISILLGGFLYYLNLEFSYHKQGLIFFHNGFSINFILLFILSPFILWCYLKQAKSFKTTYHAYYQVELICFGKSYFYTGYLDTGNKLYDPYKHRPVLLLYDPKLKIKKNTKLIYTPYEGLNHTGVIPCIVADKLIIDGTIEKEKVLIGLSQEPFKIDGVSMILHVDLF